MNSDPVPPDLPDADSEPRGENLKGPLSFPHDTFFKELMKHPRVYREFFRSFLPDDLKEGLDFHSITPTGKHFISPGLRHFYCDCLFTARWGDRPLGFYLLVEHSSRPSATTAFQVNQYLSEIWLDHVKRHPGEEVPFIFPIIFYTGRSPNHPSTAIKEQIAGPADAVARLWNEPFRLVNLHHLSREAAQRETYLGVMLLTFKHYINKRTGRLRDIFRQLGKIEKGEDLMRLLRAVVGYIFTVRRTKPETLRQLAREEIREEAGDMVMTTAELLMEQGFKKAQKEIVHKMSLSGMSPAQIADLLGLAETEIVKLLQE